MSRSARAIVGILRRTIKKLTHWDDVSRALISILVAVKAGQSGTVARPACAVVVVQGQAVAGGARFERGDHHGVVSQSSIISECFDRRRSRRELRSGDVVEPVNIN